MGRISYLDKHTASDEVKSIFETLETTYGGVVPDIYKALAHSPRGMECVLAFYQKAFPTWQLDPKLQSLASIRMAMLNRCHY
jgi:hypothetical protein